MTYTVVINHQGETVRLSCESFEEAQMVRRSFIHWGGLGYDIAIEEANHQRGV